MKTIVNFRIFPALIAVSFIVTTAAIPAFAYEEDTHFLMTYVICRSVGMTADEALTVAAADQGMDDSEETSARDGAKPQVLEQWLWHALDKDGDMRASGVLGRRDALFNDAVNERDPRLRLIKLGIFFHFQQDSWAHRHHEKDNHLSRDNYTTFNTPHGHGPYGAAPDRPPLDPVAALMSLEDGVVYAVDFIRRGLAREPNKFFSGYKPAGGSEDTAWNDKRQGKYFNQIDLAGLEPDSARLYLASLIRAQIDTYESSRNMNPFYAPRSTADKVDLIKMRAALQAVCDRFSSSLGPIAVPSQPEKIAQGFNTFTTLKLLSLRPGSMQKATP